MKFTIKSVVQLYSGRIGRSYNTFQVPELGQEYDTDENGRVIDMFARVIFENDAWFWIPIPTSYTSYNFKEERFRITF